MEKNCSIVEDLLPLYNEGLLQDETTAWVEAHLKDCPNCSKLAALSAEETIGAPIPSTVDHEKMMSKITFKLSFYQIIFVGLSFYLAMQTTLLNDSFGFILSYTVLGLITYLFYKNFKIIILIAFLPVFVWSIGTTILNMDGIYGSILVAGLHLIFAIIGSVIGLLILKLRESGDS